MTSSSVPSDASARSAPPQEPPAVREAEGATPVIAQYLEIKSANADSLLFFRMGDFYELFFEDASIASQVLGIALTRRGKHQGHDIAMAGVPVHSAQDYLHRLIKAGHKVAVCEQIEDPAEARKRGSKAVVRRDVVRLVTPGTLSEDALLAAHSSNWLLALVPEAGGQTTGLAWFDLSTGAFRLCEVANGALEAQLARLRPAETLFPDSLDPEGPIMEALQRLGGALSRQPGALFAGGQAEQRLAGAFNVQSADSFGDFSRAEVRAAAALIGYVERTQKQAFQALQPPVRERADGTMAIDAATRASLDLVRARSGEGPTLLDAVNNCVSAPGTRLLAEYLAAPLTDRAAIEARHDALDWFIEQPAARRSVREALGQVSDIARALSRVALGRAGPRDLLALGAGLEQAGTVETLLADACVPDKTLPDLLAGAARALTDRPVALGKRLVNEIAPDAPVLARDGGLIQAGVDGDLDGARALRDDARKVIAGLQSRYGQESGIKALKIRHNNVLGYFIEVPAGQAGPLQEAPQTFFHRQTMAAAMRFSTRELAQLESEITNAGTRALALELARLEELCALIGVQRQAIQGVADALAVLDVASGLAETAVREAHVRPRLHDDLTFRIVGGRHPVVEKAMRARARAQFVANDCVLALPGEAAGRVHLVTGPNMGGKSTFLRQNALIAILAQAGAFVPADEAQIGLVDALFSRVGAADDLARGRSTFMVEMVETAAILHQASPRSLVILDEIGRGTATYDGLSIAWACTEHLHDTACCRTLFATHYHELTVLAQRLERVENRTLKVREWEGEVIFLHEVGEGAADRSYGLAVARLAGLPGPVMARARAVLDHLERRSQAGEGTAEGDLFEGLPLFAARQGTPVRSAPTREDIERAAAQELAAIMAGHDPDQMTPREALDFVYDLARRLKTRA